MSIGTVAHYHAVKSYHTACGTMSAHAECVMTRYHALSCLGTSAFFIVNREQCNVLCEVFVFVWVVRISCVHERAWPSVSHIDDTAHVTHVTQVWCYRFVTGMHEDIGILGDVTKRARKQVVGWGWPVSSGNFLEAHPWTCAAVVWRAAP